MEMLEKRASGPPFGWSGVTRSFAGHSGTRECDAGSVAGDELFVCFVLLKTCAISERLSGSLRDSEAGVRARSYAPIRDPAIGEILETTRGDA
jgi:hypothetical protein